MAGRARALAEDVGQEVGATTLERGVHKVLLQAGPRHDPAIGARDALESCIASESEAK